MSELHGVTITDGLSDWQILQRDEDGMAQLRLRGTWRPGPSSHPTRRHRVLINVRHETSGGSVATELTNHSVPARADGTWQARISVPTGGLYRLETALWQWGKAGIQWAQRGDMRHHWGVGDVWIIAGQSNSSGYGKDPVEDPPELGVHLLGNDLQWDLASHPMGDSTASAHPANTENANSGHSPWLAFAKRLKAECGYPIGLAMTALGGSPLSRWDPRSSQPDLHAVFRQVLQHLDRRARGVVWYQGEGDTQPDRATTYTKRFTRMVAAWRKLARTPLTVLTAQLNRVISGDVKHPESWSMVREAQVEIAAALGDCALVPTTDLPLCDFIHTSSAGNLTLGERFAQAALAVAYQRPATWPPPQATAVRWRSQTGLRIEVAVDGALNAGNPSHRTREAVAVRTTTGEPVAVTSVRVLAEAIDIELSERPDEPVVVDIQPGSDPCPFPPHSVPGYLPIVARYGLVVTGR